MIGKKILKKGEEYRLTSSPEYYKNEFGISDPIVVIEEVVGVQEGGFLLYHAKVKGLENRGVWVTIQDLEEVHSSVTKVSK